MDLTLFFWVIYKCSLTYSNTHPHNHTHKYKHKQSHPNKMSIVLHNCDRIDSIQDFPMSFYFPSSNHPFNTQNRHKFDSFACLEEFRYLIERHNKLYYMSGLEKKASCRNSRANVSRAKVDWNVATMHFF